MQKTIEQACLEWGENSIGVLHLTFAEDVDHYEAERRMNSLQALGKASRSFIESWAEHKWGIKIQFGVATDRNTVVCGHDPFGIYLRKQLYRMALEELIERVEEIEFSQYDPNLIQF